MIPFGFLGKEAASGPPTTPPDIISYSYVDSTSATPSGSVTVPANATFGVMLCLSYTDGEDGTFSDVKLGTEGSQITFAEAYTVNDGGGAVASVFYADVSSLADGSETLSGTRGAVPDEGGAMFIVWLSGQNSTSPIIDSDADFSTSAGDDVSVTLDSTDTKLVVALTSGWYLDPNVPTGTTQLGTVHIYNTYNYMVCYTTGDDPTTTVTETADSWPFIVGVSIEGT